MKLFLLLFALINRFNNDNCTLITGGAFSGFWYFYGNLDNITDTTYCYSSSCIAIVNKIKPNTFNSTINYANNIKNLYDTKNISMHDITEIFINNIVKDIDINDLNINIITSTYFGKCIISNPKTKPELIKLLIETTNIPIITRKIDITKNIDGFFCRLNHPKCNTKISFPKTFRFIINLFNPNFTIKDLDYFYNYKKNSIVL
jgi:hypothetical protein